MTLEQLKIAVRNLGVSDDLVRIGAVEPSASDVRCICLTRLKSGRREWRTYYLEGGGHFDIQAHASEGKACAFFLDWVLDLVPQQGQA